MTQTIRLLVLGFVVALGLSLLTVVPAQASVICDWGISCGKFRHGPDRGYDRPIRYSSNWGASNKAPRLLREGHYSQERTRDVDGLFVRRNEEIWCARLARGRAVWRKEADRFGWHKRRDFWDRTRYGGCVVRHD